MHSLQIVVFGPRKEFKYDTKSIEALTFEKSDRIAALGKTNSNWVWMLDADCRPTYQIEKVFEFIQKLDPKKIYGGLYLDEPTYGWLNRAYNCLCNLWVTASRQQNLLGGSLLVPRSAIESLSDHSQPFEWGGEDAFMLRILKTKGFRFVVRSELSVFHFSRQTVAKILRRAWIHGLRGSQYSLQTEGFDYSSALRRLDFWRYLPFFVLHASCLYIAMVAGVFFRKVKSQ